MPIELGSNRDRRPRKAPPPATAVACLRLQSGSRFRRRRRVESRAASRPILRYDCDLPGWPDGRRDSPPPRRIRSRPRSEFRVRPEDRVRPILDALSGLLLRWPEPLASASLYPRGQTPCGKTVRSRPPRQPLHLPRAGLFVEARHPARVGIVGRHERVPLAVPQRRGNHGGHGRGRADRREPLPVSIRFAHPPRSRLRDGARHQHARTRRLHPRPRTAFAPDSLQWNHLGRGAAPRVGRCESPFAHPLVGRTSPHQRVAASVEGVDSIAEGSAL